MPDLYSVARAALLEVTPEETIGEPTGQVEEDGAVSVTFASRLSGYPGWQWTVSLAHLDEAEPSVLEVELMPGNGALLAPDWVPWSERLADYEAAQEALAVGELATDDSDDDSDDSDDDDHSDDSDDDDESDDEDDDDDDDLGSDVLHGGDLDGVDIDDLDESHHDADDDEDDDDLDDDDHDEDERTF